MKLILNTSSPELLQYLRQYNFAAYISKNSTAIEVMFTFMDYIELHRLSLVLEQYERNVDES